MSGRVSLSKLAATHLNLVDSFYIRRNITKLRSCDLKIESNLLRNVKPPVPKNMRICKNCDMNVPGDEEHFLTVCPKFDSIRKLFIDKYSAVTNQERLVFKKHF